MSLAGDFNGDVIVRGALSCTSFRLPVNSVINDSVDAAASIETTKLLHQYRPSYGQDSGADAATGRAVLHVAKGAGSVIDFKVGASTAGTGTASVTVDLKKNGTTVLSADVTLDSATVAFALAAGTISSAAYVAGDVFEWHVKTSSAGSGAKPKGLFLAATFREAA